MLLYRISGSLAAISCTGSALVIASYLSTKELRKHPSVMVLCLCICDLLFSLKFLVTALTPDSSSIQDTLWCDIQSSWGQYWGVASVSWNGMISLNVIINLKNPFVNMRPFVKFLHAWVWGLAAFTTIILAVWGDVGPSGDGTCWVSDPRDPFRLLFFLPLLIYFTIGLIALIMSVTHIRSIQDPLVFKNSERRSLYVRMILYVVVFIACWTGPVIHRIWELAGLSDMRDPGPLAYIDMACVSIQGFANSIVWLTSPVFISVMRKKFMPKSKEGYVRFSNESNKEEEHDVHTLNNVSRRNVIACLLHGVAAQGKADHPERPAEKHVSICMSSSSSSIDIIDFSKAKQDQDFEFIDYLPHMFSRIRELSGISTDSYLESLDPGSFLAAGADSIKVSDGKSGSFFCFSSDKKFILKTIHPEEAELLNTVLEPLLEYFLSNKDSLISRFFGFHGVKVHGGNIIHMVVMANVFSTMHKIHECYDLKGSWVDRCVGEEHEKHPSKLGLDLDLKHKLGLPENIKNLFLRQIASDSKFLCKLGIMDYSLLLGFYFCPESIVAQTDPEKLRWNQGVTSTNGHSVYYMGIIDILQLYNIRKKVERFAKSYLLYKDRKGISAVPPQEYSARFIRGMERIVD